MSQNPHYTIHLQACDDAKALYYKVSVIDDNDKVVKGFLHKTENYNEALIYARVFFDQLSQSNIVVASYIEQPGRVVGQGALYSIGSFATAAPNEDGFYDSLSEEFLERCRRENSPDINVIFRKIVQKHKLNLYKEGKFLNKLQQLGILESNEDNGIWVEEL